MVGEDAAENDAPSGGGGNDFVGAGLPGGMLRAERYLRSSSSDAYDLRVVVGVLTPEERGGSESENEPPPNVMADVGVGVRDLLTLIGACEEGVRVADRVDLEFVGEIEDRLEEDASSNAGSGEKEEGGIVSCGSGALAWLCVDSTDALDEIIFLNDKGWKDEGRKTDAFVEGLGVGTGGGVGWRGALGVAGDFLRRLKRGILRLAFVEGSVEGVEVEVEVEEC